VPHARECRLCDSQSHRPACLTSRRLSTAIVALSARGRASPRPRNAQASRSRNARAKGPPVLHVNRGRTRQAIARLRPFVARAANANAIMSRPPTARCARRRCKTGHSILAKAKADGQSKIRHCRPMRSKQKRPPLLTSCCTDEQSTVASTKPSVVDALLLTLRPISIADPVATRHGRTK